MSATYQVCYRVTGKGERWRQRVNNRDGGGKKIRKKKARCHILKRANDCCNSTTPRTLDNSPCCRSKGFYGDTLSIAALLSNVIRQHPKKNVRTISTDKTQQSLKHFSSTNLEQSKGEKKQNIPSQPL